MKEKYELLCSLKVIEVEIAELARYAQEFDGCYDLLKSKLDDLCAFINRKENIVKWNQWSELEEVQELSQQLRETSVNALCDVEKYQSIRAQQVGLPVGQYVSSLAQSVRDEYHNFGIHSESNVLFIGSGAFPTTALTIAKETGANVICLDIDHEAIELSREVARASGLEKQIAFLHGDITAQHEFETITHVFIASLVKDKLEVIDVLKEKVWEGTKVIVRFGNGLKSIFNYPIDEIITGNWLQRTVPHEKSDSIYETLVLEKKSKVMT
ncbi:hypothetical protein IQ283_14190 [Alkalihalobacillus hwajinpoensis]|uniref:nicotianamine synthase family protein n=1 Tax=Guptibacillus hwajinpoensis TaxID=208199 RepID=UPI0018834466|nr:nicotianamine synthase family protein [Pseudalkalibacillus hwajinpoensis]MBF0707743.1 hypothetical protein [Pseudalkalibacillus hwajinpoensis]